MQQHNNYMYIHEDYFNQSYIIQMPKNFVPVHEISLDKTPVVTHIIPYNSNKITISTGSPTIKDVVIQKRRLKCKKVHFVKK